jgi:transcription-repair coupling factor (superfamily II helicase)
MPDMSDQADRGMEINLQITCLIPREYIPDIHMRLLFYKRIANAKNIDDLNDLRIEMIDRFGLIPTQLDNLFKLSMVKLLLQPFGVIKIIGNKEYITVNFSDNANVDSSKIIRLIQTEHRKYILKGQSSLRINLNNDSYQARFDALENFVKKIK